jgi:hypothetical protein
MDRIKTLSSLAELEIQQSPIVLRQVIHASMIGNCVLGKTEREAFLRQRRFVMLPSFRTDMTKGLTCFRFIYGPE